jgi:hypothetical protein
LGLELGVAGSGVRGAGVDMGGEVTTDRAATLKRGEALSVPHTLDQMPTATQARTPMMSANRIRRSQL